MSDRTGIINGLILDAHTGNIRIGTGATGWFTAVFHNADAGTIDTEKDVVLFIVANGNTNRTIRSYVNGVYAERAVNDIAPNVDLKKLFSVSVNDDGEYECVIGLNNEETRKLSVGKYYWNAILVTDPEYDDDGMPIADTSDQVIPFFINGERPTLSVEEVGYVV